MTNWGEKSVEETLNTLLNAEVNTICQASRYQRSSDRLDTRAGSYMRKLLTQAGEVELRIPRLRTLPFETQIIKRYKTRQSSVEEALIEMYLMGVSVRRVKDIVAALWGTGVSFSTVSDLNKKGYVKNEQWRMRPSQANEIVRPGQAQICALQSAGASTRRRFRFYSSTRIASPLR